MMIILILKLINLMHFLLFAKTQIYVEMLSFTSFYGLLIHYASMGAILP